MKDDSKLSYNLGNEYTLVLDTNGYVLYTDGTAGHEDYVYIAAIKETGGVKGSMEADAYFIGGTKGALSLPRLHTFSYDGDSSWHKPLKMDVPAVDPALPHKMQLKHFVQVVRREVAPVVTPADNVKTLRLLTAVKKAAETGELVEL